MAEKLNPANPDLSGAGPPVGSGVPEGGVDVAREQLGSIRDGFHMRSDGAAMHDGTPAAPTQGFLGRSGPSASDEEGGES